MTLLAPDTGDQLFLKYALNNTAASNPKLHLYTNNYTPAKGDTTGSYTECSTATGYAAVTLPGTSWTVSTTSHVTTASYAAQTFTLTASATIYGYYITDNSSSNVLWAELFSGGPFNIPSGGGSVTVTPTITCN